MNLKYNLLNSGLDILKFYFHFKFVGLSCFGYGYSKAAGEIHFEQMVVNQKIFVVELKPRESINKKKRGFHSFQRKKNLVID